MSNTSTQEFIQAHAVDGLLDAEQAAKLLELAMGDTGSAPESSEPPAAAAKDGTQTEAAPQASAQTEPEPANSVVQARDGVHTIPYERLTEARQQAQQYRTQLEAEQARRQQLEQELEAARAAAQQRADAGMAPTQADANLAAAEQAMAQGVDPDLFGDFSEEALAKGVAMLVDQRVNDALSKALAPLQQKQQQEAATAHEQAIYAAHPDADAIAESRELVEWINAKVEAMPIGVRDAVRAGYERVLDQGSASEVVDLLDAFKRDSGRTQPAADAKAAAKAAVAGAKTPVPASLSDIPGGSAGPSSKFEALASMNPAEMSEAMAAMSPEQIEAFLNRNG